MRKIEQRIVDILEELTQKELDGKVRSEKRAEFESLLKQLDKELLGELTPEFLSNELLAKYLKKRNCEQAIRFRVLIEKYLIASDPKIKGKYFSEIVEKIDEIKKETFKSHGQGLLPEAISCGLIRSVYLSENEELIKLFSERLPIPSIEVFETYPIPHLVQSRTEEATKAVIKFLEGRTLSSVEPTVTKIQRNFRAKRRQREEIARIAEYYEVTKQMDSSEKKEEIEWELREANTPYEPKRCSLILGKRIFNAAKKVKLFSTVHHLTSETSLENIFNDSFYGRRTLLQLYLSFSPATLSSCDLEYGGGDANVICFGPNEIDPKAVKEDSIDILFDLDKLKENPCVFYKQRDLGYYTNTVRKVTIGKYKTLLFTHTKELNLGKRGYTNLQILAAPEDPGKPIAYSELTNYHFIAYNVPDMHQILTLNFFRFIDELRKTGLGKTGQGYPRDEATISSIYNAIEKLDEKELDEFLTNLGQQMTDTAEFNFYGAYKIDFSAIRTIYSKRSHYTLNLSTFVEDLQLGNKEKLNELRENIPTILKSYRFLDYLISKIQNEIIKKELLELRQACRVPLWMKSMQKGLEKSRTLSLRLESLQSSFVSEPSSISRKSVIQPKHSEKKILEEDFKIKMDNQETMKSCRKPVLFSKGRRSLVKVEMQREFMKNGYGINRKTLIPREALKESITKDRHWINFNFDERTKYTSKILLFTRTKQLRLGAKSYTNLQILAASEVLILQSQNCSITTSFPGLLNYKEFDGPPANLGGFFKIF